MSRYFLGWSCPGRLPTLTKDSSVSPCPRTFMQTVLQADQQGSCSSVAASSDCIQQNVEDLRLISSTPRVSSRKRLHRHRAKKRRSQMYTFNQALRQQERKAQAVAQFEQDYPVLPKSTPVEMEVKLFTVWTPKEDSYKHVLTRPAPKVVVPMMPLLVKPQHGFVSTLYSTCSVNLEHKETDTKTTASLSTHARPLVELCRDRRRRITSIKKYSRFVSCTRKDLALHLRRSYHPSSIGSRKTQEELIPFWAKYNLSWTPFTPSIEQVTSLLASDAGNLIPIQLDMAADLLTPVSAYLKLAYSSLSPSPSSTRTTAFSFLFESVSGGEKIGRYSFMGTSPYKVIRIGDKEDIHGDPLVTLEQEMKPYRYVPVNGVTLFTGGAVGYISYDCVRFFEPKTSRSDLSDPLELPDAVFMFFDTLVIFDHLHHVMKIVSHFKVDPQKNPTSLSRSDIQAEYDRACQTISRLVQVLNAKETPLPPQPPILLGQEAVSNVGKAGYEGFVHQLKHHITEGDIIQAVPSQRLTKPTTLHPFNAYRQLRSVNPSPYMFYVDLGEFQLVGASPEMLVKVDQRIVFTHPIAGTRRRGATPEEDEALAENLLSDIKERSEHIMLVDLGRNDVNRVCQPETVKVDSLMHIERYSHVMHIVSHVSGVLRAEKTPFDAFRSIFPAGTVSGAPKVKAMELIYALEKQKRGAYAGAVGYFSYSGSVDTCIAIRTMVFKDGNVYLQAGGGIVYDSVPQDEFEETVNKLKSNVTAIEKAELYYHQLQQLDSLSPIPLV